MRARALTRGCGAFGGQGVSGAFLVLRASGIAKAHGMGAGCLEQHHRWNAPVP